MTTKVGLGHVPLLQFCSSEVHNEQNKWPSQKDKKSTFRSTSRFGATFRSYRNSEPHLREADDFAGDVSRVPGDGDLPHDVRQDADDADA
jgi:hypothetical protein